MTTRVLLAGAVALAAGALAACGTASPPPALAVVPGAPAATPAIGADGQAWGTSTDHQVVYTADAGRSWKTVALQGEPMGLSGRGGQLAAVTADDAGVGYAHSADGGATWRRTPLAAVPGDAAVALSPDGATAGVLVDAPGTAPALFTGPAAGPLTARPAPVAGDLTWVGNRLLLTGGPARSLAYTSDDAGATWTQRSVDGSTARRFNASPDAASLGVPLTGDDAVTVPVTAHGTPSVLRFYRSTDGVAFTPGATVALRGQTGPGVAVPVSAAGPGRFVVADPAGVLHVLAGGQDQVIAPAGLPGPVQALAFTDAQTGIAEASRSDGCTSKSTCTSTVVTLRTTDGGHTWSPIR